MNYRLGVSIAEEANGYKLKVDSGLQETDLLFRIFAILYARGWWLSRGSIQKLDSQNVRNEFYIRYAELLDHMPEKEIQDLVEDMEQLLINNVPVLEYLQSSGIQLSYPEGGKGQVQIDHSPSETWLSIRTHADKGVFLSIAKAFYLMDILVVGAHILTDTEGMVQCRFEINPEDSRFQNPESRKRIREEIRALL